MKVKYVDLGAQWASIRIEALEEIDKVLTSGMYLEHPVVKQLEENLQNYLGVNYVVSLNSGTDALMMSLVALGIKRGDEIITIPNSFIASVAAIEHIGAKTVFVDVNDEHLIDIELIEAAITRRTAAIMPVHLEGKMSNMVEIKRIADKFGLKIIEDAAQSIGSNYNGINPGNLSDIACFSLHPLKNLNGLGDGGFIATNNKDLADRISALRNHGQVDRNVSVEFGTVSRLDSIQAAVLNIKLNHLDSIIKKRQHFAGIYDKLLSEVSVSLPKIGEGVHHAYHLYVIEVENRDKVKQDLLQAGIETKIHYPTLICDQKAFKQKYPESNFEIPKAREQSRKILSLPIHQNLTDESVEFVSAKLKECT